MIKILHCADIHLDTPFSLEDVQIAELRRKELRSVFVNMMMYARSSGVQILLLAGDLFDHPSPSPETVDMVQRELAASAGSGMKIFIAPGNHDPLLSGGVWEKLSLPEGVHLFRETTPKKVEIPELNTCVYGYAFTAPTMLRCPFAGGVMTDPGKINLLVGHGDTTSPASPDCPIRREDIAASGMDYIALGHIHGRSPLLREGSSYFAYPGCLEGRDFGETGEKGALLLLAEKEDGVFHIKENFLRFSRRQYETIELDVSGIPSPEALCQRLKALFREKGFGMDTLLRIYAAGEAQPGLLLSRSALHDATDRLFYAEIKDRTIPAVDKEGLSHDPTIRGAFYESLLPMLEGEDEEQQRIAAMALRFGLAALADRDITGSISQND